MLKQIIKFVFVGGINTAVDLAVLNVLIYLFGTGENNMYFTAFKALSFIAAVINSYFLNKYWVFEEKKTDQPEKSSKQKILFFGVSGVGFLINVLISTFAFGILINLLPQQNQIVGNISAVIGTLTVMIWNYIGYKYIVFK